MKKRSGLCPRVHTDATGSGVVSQAGGVTLVETVRAAGLDAAMSQALSPWRKPLAVHDPAKVLLDLAVTLALGGDCLADIALLRAEPEGVRRGGLRPDSVADHRRIGRRRPPRAGGHRHRPGAGASQRVVAGRQPCSRPRRRCQHPTGHRPGRDLGHRPQRQGAGSRPPSSGDMASIRCGPSPTTAPARVLPDATPLGKPGTTTGWFDLRLGGSGCLRRGCAAGGR